MADDGDRRVEARNMLVGRGSGTTPEKVADIQRKVAEVERASRPPPTTPFSAILAKGRGEGEEEELSEKEKKLRALPKRGPRPGLVHPSQRDVYGRDEEAEDTVVLKG